MELTKVRQIPRADLHSVFFLPHTHLAGPAGCVHDKESLFLPQHVVRCDDALIALVNGLTNGNVQILY